MNPRIDTAEHILRTAENLFARHGVEAVSVRQIQEKAGVNVAAVHYHFGSRADLIRAVLRRRVEPLNARRIALLEVLEAAHPAPAPLALEDVLRAFVTPVFELLEEEPNAAWLMAHVHTTYDDKLRKWYFELFAPLVLRFQPAYLRALPALAPAVGWARMQFVWGSMMYLLVRAQRSRTLGASAPPELPAAALIDEWVAFCAAGLRAGKQSP